MKKLLYLGRWVFLVSVFVSCMNSGEENVVPEKEMKIISTRDTIVILDPDSGRELMQVVDITDTVWTQQLVKQGLE